MNIRELKKAIENLPDTMEVFISERKTEFQYGLVNNAYVKEIGFAEDPNEEPLAKDKVLILDEE